jgi:hypothetical protein
MPLATASMQCKLTGSAHNGRTNAVRGTNFAHRILCFPFVKPAFFPPTIIKPLFFINKK